MGEIFSLLARKGRFLRRECTIALGVATQKVTPKDSNATVLDLSKIAPDTASADGNPKTTQVSGENFSLLARKGVFYEENVLVSVLDLSKITFDTASADGNPKTTQVSGEDFSLLARKCGFL